jgi:hypothetical protein
MPMSARDAGADSRLTSMRVTVALVFSGTAALLDFAGALVLATASPLAFAVLGAADFLAVAALLGLFAFSSMGDSSIGIWLPRGLLILRLQEDTVNGNLEQAESTNMSNDERT